MDLDAGTAPDGATLEADICIVGGGPAGLTLAHELRARGRQVVLLESGGATPAPATDELNLGETAGDPYSDLRLVRSRCLGGTAAIWNSFFRGAPLAKYLPLDPIDFEARNAMPWSGWPVSGETLRPYYHRVHILAGLAPPEYAVARWTAPDATPLAPAGGLSSGVHHYGRADRFTVTLPALLAVSGGITLVRGATVTELVRPAPGDRITSARWTALSGSSGSVRAGVFVLAAGGIENARLLLLNGQRQPWLGRGFMEHPVEHGLELLSRHAALNQKPGFYAARGIGADTAVGGRLGFDPALLRAEGLGNAAVRIAAPEDPPILESARLRPAARRLVPFRAVRRRIGDVVRGIARVAQRYRAARHALFLDLEQRPHPDNRIVLADRRDRFGLPMARLEWRWRPEDEAGRERLRTLLIRGLAEAGVGRVVRTAGARLDPAAHHHMGATRMHPDPALGVVDADGRVHGMENLFVTGSSVFPTAGVANPTLTLLALTLRLADHLAGGA